MVDAARDIEDIFKNDLFRILSEPTRIKIIRFLVTRGPSDVSTIAAAFPQDRSVISRHLKQLRDSGIVQVYSFDGEVFLERLDSLAGRVRALVECGSPACSKTGKRKA
jgi:DNA-binding transcriptional ArsR family regulator